MTIFENKIRYFLYKFKFKISESVLFFTFKIAKKRSKYLILGLIVRNT